jgi:hypothetical protein
MKHTATDFLLVSECVDRLVQGMWGSLPRPQPVTDAKRGDRHLSVGFGPRREESKALLRSAALEGTLRIYVQQRHTGRRGGPKDVFRLFRRISWR